MEIREHQFSVAVQKSFVFILEIEKDDQVLKEEHVFTN